MPDDIEMSAEQEENEEQEMSTEEQDALFDMDESEIEEGDAKEIADDESEDQDEDDESGEDDDGYEEGDDDDDDESEESEEEEEDDDPLAEIKAKAAALKQTEQDATDKATADAERAKNMEVAKAEALKELFDSDKIIGQDGVEIDMVEFRENYGAELEGVMAAMAFKMMDSAVEKTMEKSNYASNEDLQSIKAENAEFRLMSQIAQTHPEVWNLKTDDKFWSWVDAQGDDVGTLMNDGSAASVSSVIGAYKKATIQSANKKIDKSAADKKKKHTDLHGSTVRSKGGKRKGTKSKNDGQMSNSEASALFDEAEVDD